MNKPNNFIGNVNEKIVDDVANDEKKDGDEKNGDFKGWGGGEDKEKNIIDTPKNVAISEKFIGIKKDWALILLSYIPNKLSIIYL